MAHRLAAISKLLQQAIELYFEGQLKEAESVLLTLIETDPANEQALILLFESTESIDLQIQCLNKVLEINPFNLFAKQELQKIKKEQKRSKKRLKSDAGEKDEKITKEKGKRPKKKQEGNQSSNGSGKGAKTEKARYAEAKHPKRKSSNAADKTEDELVARKEKEPPDKLNSNEKENESEEGKGEKSSESQHIPDVKIPEPELIKRSPEDNFFFGFREGIDITARLETGMFGTIIVVDGIRMSPYNGPACFYLEKTRVYAQCHSCTFFSPLNCLLRYDEYLLDDIRRFTEIREERADAQARKRRVITRTIQKELRAHGRPLHYTVIAKIIMGRYPKFRLNAHRVYHFLRWNPELFERVDAGVYRAK